MELGTFKHGNVYQQNQVKLPSLLLELMSRVNLSFTISRSISDILREFNPNLKGFSVGSGNETSTGAGFNVAVAGAISQ